MADKNKGVSETFGKYAGKSAGKDGKAVGPKNITSDMWTPISAGQGAEPPTEKAKVSSPKRGAPEQKKKSAPQKNTPSQKNGSGQTGLISEGRKKDTESKKSKKTQSKKKKSPAKSRVPKGRPVSELISERGKTEKQKKAEEVRNRQKLNKAERDIDGELKGGKSPTELSKERAARKRKKRIRQNALIIILFLVFALAFAGIYTYTKGAPAGVIIVEGDSIYSDEEIIAASGLEIGVNMFSVKEAEVNGRVTASLPYVHSVQVKRKLSDKLILTVTPTKEKYLFVNKGESVAVDGYGKALADGEDMTLTDGLYRVYGVGWESYAVGTAFVPSSETAEKYSLAVNVVAALEKDNAVLKATVNVSDTDNIRVYCVNGESKIMIYLGSGSDLEGRISLAGKVLKTEEVAGKTGYIDVRFDNAYFREGSIYL